MHYATKMVSDYRDCYNGNTVQTSNLDLIVTAGEMVYENTIKNYDSLVIMSIKNGCWIAQLSKKSEILPFMRIADVRSAFCFINGSSVVNFILAYVSVTA